jgi:uncharacterized protein
MGRGVFAGERIRMGRVIEACPVIPLSAADEQKLSETVLDKYMFSWGDGLEGACIALGLGSIFNHSATPNAVACRVHDRTEIEFIALRDIEEGEQILADYDWEPDEYHFPREG